MIVFNTVGRLLVLITALAVILTATGGCAEESRTQSDKASEPLNQGQNRPPLRVPVFDRDSAYAYLSGQVNFGPRVPGTEGQKACKDWLVGKPEQFGAETIVQEFTPNMTGLGKQPSYNIIGSYNSEAKRRILLAAHWDTRHKGDYDPDPSKRDQAIPGADDGASGVAVLLEVARQLQLQPIDIGIDIVFFDAEDQGYDSSPGEQPRPESWCLGAQHWSASPHRRGYKAEYGVLLDMVGSANARFPKEGYSMHFAPQVVEKVWKLALEMGFGNYFDTAAAAGAVTDDHYFVNTIAGIPMIDIINKPMGSETGFGPHWHTHGDDLDVIDTRTLRAVGQIMLALLYNEDYGSI